MRFPGMTANFDAGKTAALALSLPRIGANFGAGYAQAMIDVGAGVGGALQRSGFCRFAAGKGFTRRTVRVGGRRI